ncbi:MAG: histidine kinase [Cyclobacteriaceae bacterium]
MSIRSPKNILSFRKVIVLNTLFWVVIWAIALWNNFQWAESTNREFSIDTVLSWSFPYYLSFALIGPLVYLLLIRWIDYGYSKQVLLHLGPAVLTGFVHQLGMFVFASLFSPNLSLSSELTFWEKLSLQYDRGFFFSIHGFLFYWLVVGIFYSIIIYQKYRREELNNLVLKSDLNVAKLQSLQMQLQPHFLFNSFNTISMMARKNKMAEVVEMIGALGELLRESLALKDTQMLPLSKELELTKKYLQIQQVRLHDRFTLHIDIPKVALETMVPSLMFQPIVENAFKHGIEKTSGQVSFHITGSLDGRQLTLQFFNEGTLLDEKFEINNHAGFGLTTVVSRLEHAYEEDFRFELKNTQDRKGVVAELTLPLSQ